VEKSLIYCSTSLLAFLIQLDQRPFSIHLQYRVELKPIIIGEYVLSCPSFVSKSTRRRRRRVSNSDAFTQADQTRAQKQLKNCWSLMLERPATSRKRIESQRDMSSTLRISLCSSEVFVRGVRPRCSFVFPKVQPITLPPEGPQAQLNKHTSTHEPSAAPLYSIVDLLQS
jgi:hypothetical protein